MSQLIQPLEVSCQVSFALFSEIKLKCLRLGYCQGMTLVAAVFAANEDAESEERRCQLAASRRMPGTSWLVARPTTASLSSFNVCEAFGCRELKWCQTMEVSQESFVGMGWMGQHSKHSCWTLHCCSRLDVQQMYPSILFATSHLLFVFSLLKAQVSVETSFCCHDKKQSAAIASCGLMRCTCLNLQ